MTTSPAPLQQGVQKGGKTVLVLGAGAREHALAWKLARSPEVGRVVVAPGNDGMPADWERWEIGAARAADFEALARRAREAHVALTVVGPDQYLADGVVDVFRRQGLIVFGPTAAAARIEASKAFAKEIMAAAGVPTARFGIARGYEEAEAFLAAQPWGAGWVVKADGLALGKGVRVCASPAEALEAARDLAQLGPELVIEERLAGEELSWMAFCDGERCALLEPARDYKRLGEHDRGPNTGGMGSFSPVPGLAPELADRVRDEVFRPVLGEMKKRGIPFQGVLYAGLMLAADGRFAVLEFNARFGDPETQVLLPRIQGDLLPWLMACAKGALESDAVPFQDSSAVYVVAAAPGYPERPHTGQRISGAERAAFFAGVKRQGEGLAVSGGRVLGALGESPGRGSDALEAARTRAYERLSQIRFEGMQWRADIAERKS